MTPWGMYSLYEGGTMYGQMRLYFRVDLRQGYIEQAIWKGNEQFMPLKV